MHPALEKFPANCGSLSVRVQWEMAYGATKYSTKVCITYVAVVFWAKIRRVCSKYVSIITTINLLPILVLGRGPSISSLQHVPEVRAVETIAADVGALGVADVFDVRGISHVSIDVISHMWPIIRPFHGVVHTSCSKTAGYPWVVFLFQHLFL